MKPSKELDRCEEWSIASQHQLKPDMTQVLYFHINSFNYKMTLLFRETLRYASTQKPGMGRLTDAKHYAGNSNTVSSQRTEKNISYNRNGCITGLERYGAEGLSESVIFGHTGNRLSSLSSWNGAGLLENGYFTYDAMGNMLTDSRKGLEFSYNLANLPESVEGWILR